METLIKTNYSYIGSTNLRVNLHLQCVHRPRGWLAITKPFLDPSTRYKNSSHNEQEPLEIRGQKLRAERGLLGAKRTAEIAK